MDDTTQDKAKGFIAKIKEGRKFWAFLYACTAYTAVLVTTAFALGDKITNVNFDDVAFWTGLGYATLAAVFFAANAVEHLAKAYARSK